MHSQRMIGIVGFVLLFITVFTIPCVEAQGRWQPGDTGSMRLFFGEFVPNGDSLYWDEKFADFTGSIGDFDDFIFGGDYRLPVNEYSAVLFGMSWYEGSATQGYREWVDGGGRDIRHVTTLTTWDATVAWIVEFGGRGSRLTPYLGAGGGYLAYDLVERGDFIDFSDPDLPVIWGVYSSRGSTWQLMAVAGLDFKISPTFSIIAQGRWRDADVELRGGLSGLGTLDLSGYDYSLGFGFHF